MTARAFMVLLAAVAFAISPFLNPEFGGFDPEAYPNPQNNPPVQPAGYAFAIWGIIYLWVLAHAGVGLFKYRTSAHWDETRLPLLLSLAVGMFWLPVALTSPIWATVMIWIMLFGAIWAVMRARLGPQPWLLALPLGLYAGWLSAASFVAIGLLGAGYGLVLGEPGWAILALSLATVFAVVIQAKLAGIWTYGVAASWGFAAIAVANMDDNLLIAGLAAVATVVLLAMTARSILSR